jgi:2-polyprenyl-3-methyl-5-hydroxy-6-metoxy-1,4-benzoquinol methylase
MNNNYNKLIAESWNENSFTRNNDIESGNDSSYVNVIIPYVKNKINEYFNDNIDILDIGCGNGFLTNIISKTHPNITGIDLSEKFIKQATQKYPNIPFIFDDFHNLSDVKKYDLCIATMVIHNTPDLPMFLKKVNSLLNENGYILIITLHPVLWAKEKVPEIIYRLEKHYEVPYRDGKGVEYPAKLHYFHRPLTKYLREIENNGFSKAVFEELFEFDDQGNRKADSHIISLFSHK